MKPHHKKLWLGLVLMALLSPLGLVLPAVIAAVDAWGEWSSETLRLMLGYLPEGMALEADWWPAPLPDYNLGTAEGSAGQALAYVASAHLGGLAVGLVGYGIWRLLVRHGH